MDCCQPHTPHSPHLPHSEPVTDAQVPDVLLALSVIQGNLPGVMQALAAGANVDSMVNLSPDTSPTVVPCVTGGAPDAVDVLDVTPIMRAAALGNKDMVRSLVDASASLVCRDSRGWSPLCYALAACELDLARQMLALANSQDPVTETLYLPEFHADGINLRRLLVGAEGNGEFRVLPPPGHTYLHYRRSARGDDQSCRWAEKGSTVRGVLRDGWLQVELEAESQLEVVKQSRKSVLAECEAKRGAEASAHLRRELYPPSQPFSARTASRLMERGARPMFVP